MSATKNEKRNFHPVDVAAGLQLRFARVSAGLTQTELGDVVGITFQQVQKYERGINRMSLSRAAEFARVLKISPAQFFADSGLGYVSPNGRLDHWVDLLAHAQRGGMDDHLLRITRAIIRSWNLDSGTPKDYRKPNST